MNKVQKFNVFSRGEIKKGSGLKEVISSFAALFQISEEEAAEYVTTKKLIGNQLSGRDADAYIENISATGLLLNVVGKDSSNDKSLVDSPKSPESAPAKKLFQSSVQEPSRLQVNCPNSKKKPELSAFIDKKMHGIQEFWRESPWHYFFY